MRYNLSRESNVGLICFRSNKRRGGNIKRRDIVKMLRRLAYRQYRYGK